MNICLIRLPSPFLVEDHLFPPLGLMAVATNLNQQGHHAVIYDGPLDKWPLGYDIYGFGPTIAEYADALYMKNQIRSIEKNARFIIGGPFATVRPIVCAEDGFDFVVTGDGELAANDAINNKMFLIKGEEIPLNQYPMIDRSLVNIKSYRYYIDNVLATTIMTGRGCPFSCGFCSKNHCSVRLQSAALVKKEIDYLYDEFGYRALAFPEDLFILNKKRAEEIFMHMAKRVMVSRCLVRADVVVKHGIDFAVLMSSCGCYHVGMGIESGSDTILKNINKGESVATIKKAIRILRDAAIKVKGFFIVGLPGESRKTLSETRAFLDEMDLFDVDIKIFQPYPGSPIWENKDKYDIDWDDQDYATMFYKGRPGEYFGTIRTSELTTREIYDAWVEMEGTYKKYD